MNKQTTWIAASIFAVSLILGGCASAPADPPAPQVSPVPPVDEAWWQTKQGNGGLIITGYIGSETVITIPETIRGLPVIGIEGVATPDEGVFRSVFEGTVGSVTIPDGMTYIGDGVFYDIPLTSVTIPNSVTSIGDAAFAFTHLTTVTIPASVISIGTLVFKSCSNLTAITVEAQNPNFSSVDGVLFSKDKHTLVAYPGGKSSSYTIPDGVITIGDVAFAFTSLTSVTIPDSVISIGNAAFASTSLTSVTLPDSVTSIAYEAFGSTRLTSVTIPSSVTDLAINAFDNGVQIIRE
jgi:hypothetical protein